MGDIQLSETTLNNMADRADDVVEGVEGAGTAISGGETPDIAGFDTLTALQDVTNLWVDSKIVNCTHTWNNHADNIRETAKNVDATDDENSWHIASS